MTDKGIWAVCKRIMRATAILSLSVLIGASAATAETWRQEIILGGLPVHGPIHGPIHGPVHGVHGLAFGPDGALYVGSVMGQNIVRVDPGTGDVTGFIPAPYGEADDLAFGPDGTVAWTALNAGELRLRESDGTIRTVASDLPFVNPVTFGPDGTLYAATLFGPDRLWAFDLNTDTSRIVAEGLGGLNGFEFGEDGLLYTPLPQRQAVGKIDVETGQLTVVAEGLGNIVAVKFHPDGLLYGVSWNDGVISRIDPASGWSETVAIVPPPLDNLAIDRDGLIYVSRSADNGIVAVDPVSGSQRVIVRSDLAAPGGMTWVSRDGRPHLLITDIFGYRYVDPKTGRATFLPFDLEGGASADAHARDGLLATTYVRRNRVLLKDDETNETVQTWADVETPYGVLVESNGSVLVALHEQGTLVRLSLDTAEKQEVVARSLNGPVGLAWAEQDRAVYVAEATTGRISRVELTTGARQTVVAGLSQPEGIAVLPDGRIAVAEVGAARVVAVEPTKGEITILAKDLALGGPISRAPDPVAMPTGIAVDAQGAVFVVTDANNGLIKLVKD